MTDYFTEEQKYYGNTNPKELLDTYGSPLYVYNEKIYREKCNKMANLVDYNNFKVTYSVKANSNLYLLKLAKDEGLHADAMSPGEIFLLLKAGFKADEIFYISNNVSEDEMKYAIDKGIMTSVDSLSQLEMYGEINNGGKVAVRFNTGVGAGHHQKVITGGKKTKFGINIDKADDVKKILKKYNLTLAGINQHIGSLFMEGDKYIEGVKFLLETAMQFKNLDFIDFGGGFGIPYKKQEGQEELKLEEFGNTLSKIFKQFANDYGKEILFRTEPGRFISAESGVLLGEVYATKNNYGKKFAGTDLGFNVLARPMMYDSHHEIEVYRDGKIVEEKNIEAINIVGNICESGDFIVKDRMLPKIEKGDIVGVMDAGAYGFSMSSNYNMRLRPAEVVIDIDGNHKLVRKRDCLEDLTAKFEGLGY